MKPTTRVAMWRWLLAVALDRLIEPHLPPYHINKLNLARRLADTVLRAIIP